MITRTECRVETLTPEQSAQLLADCRFPKQRTLRREDLEKYKRLMTAGEFWPSEIIKAKLNGTTYLLNGNHRLTGHSELDTAQAFVITTHHVTDESDFGRLYRDIDTGTVRTIRDGILATGLHDELDLTLTEAVKLSGAVGMLGTGFSTSSVRASSKKSRTEIEALLRYWIEPARAYFATTSCRPPELKTAFQRASVIAIGVATFRYQPELAEQFWRAAAEDSGLLRGTPAKTWVDYMRGSQAAERGASFAVRWLHATMLCWNAHYRRQSIYFPKVNAVTRFALEGTPFKESAKPRAVRAHDPHTSGLPD